MADPKKLFVTQGELKVTIAPAIIQTVLGSCVAVCLRDNNTGISGMNHYMLPESQTERDSLRYGDYSTRTLISRIRERSGEAPALVAKIFGGANVMASIKSPIGDKNVEIARRILHESGIRITAESVGGIKHRKIIFDTETGKVKVFSPRESEQRILIPVNGKLAKRRRLLLVDNVKNRMLALKRYLQRSGYVTIINHDPRDAIERAGHEEIDVVITDSVSAFSENGGGCFCVLCKSHDRLKDIPIIVYSLADNKIIKSSNERYADFYLNKVKDEQELHDQIMNILLTLA